MYLYFNIWITILNDRYFGYFSEFKTIQNLLLTKTQIYVPEMINMNAKHVVHIANLRPFEISIARYLNVV